MTQTAFYAILPRTRYSSNTSYHQCVIVAFAGSSMIWQAVWGDLLSFIIYVLTCTVVEFDLWSYILLWNATVTVNGLYHISTQCLLFLCVHVCSRLYLLFFGRVFGWEVSKKFREGKLGAGFVVEDILFLLLLFSFILDCFFTLSRCILSRSVLFHHITLQQLV